MLSLGPVVRYELITTARRARFYLVRLVYGLALLMQLWILFRIWELNNPHGGTITEVQEFAQDVFIRFAAIQGLALLCITPALVAGVIADEYQRKTLHYLLASRLSSAEIVLGKLGARLVHVGTFVAVGLPIVSLLLLYGGLNPQNVFYVYLGTFALIVFLAGTSMLVSTLARRPRDAILAAYGILAFWLLVPPAIEPFAHHLGFPLGWVEPANDWLMASNPINVWLQATNVIIDWATRRPRPVWFVWGFESLFYWMVGIQCTVGLMFLLLAVAGLRPLRGTSWPGGKPRTGWWARLSDRLRAMAHSHEAAPLVQNELLATPRRRAPCGDDPMLWKERHIRLGGGLKWLRSRPVALFCCVLLGCFLFDAMYPIVGDFVRGRRNASSWSEFAAALRFTSLGLALIGMLPIAAAAATSVTGEREQDTWISLATTLLTPAEIIRAKQFGAVWSARWIGLALLVLWGAGILLGALHPLGVIAAAAIVATTAWLTAAVGVAASTRAKNSIRALAITFVAAFLFGVASGWPPMFWAALAPSGENAPWWSSSRSVVNYAEGWPLAGLEISVALLALYATCAWLISSWSIWRMATTSDAPDRGAVLSKQSKWRGIAHLAGNAAQRTGYQLERHEVGP
jgi:ABC-type transport system involved in multi-copper enzyme maturation permease subunit